MKFVTRILKLGVAFVIAVSAPKVFSCSVFFVEGSKAVVAKNLDWFSGAGVVLVNKRGWRKKAILVDTTYSLEWTSKYASLTVSGSGQEFPWEGLNETGLSVNVLQLLSSVTSAPQVDQPTVGYIQWVQYLLDTSADLNEAIQNAQKVRLSSGTTVHYFVCDSTSACATFESINGQLTIHAGVRLPYKALTNDSYERSVKYFSSIANLPEHTILYDRWSINSLARFSRAAVWSKNYSPTTEDAIAHAFRGLANLAQFVPATSKFPGWSTYWSLAFDLRKKIIYWRTKKSPQIKSISFSSFKSLNCTSGVASLDVNSAGGGDTASRFHLFTREDQRRMVDAWANSMPESRALSPEALQAIKNFPSTMKCMM